MRAFVSTYRCGAVPDLHRSSLLSHSDRKSESGTNGHNISAAFGAVNPIDCGLTVDKPENSWIGAELEKARKFSWFKADSPFDVDRAPARASPRCS
jgi:hypothetical protein